jgi:hypothetical protein
MNARRLDHSTDWPAVIEALRMRFTLKEIANRVGYRHHKSITALEDGSSQPLHSTGEALLAMLDEVKTTAAE